MDPYNKNETVSTIDLRPRPNRTFNDSPKLQISKSSFGYDAARLWNLAPSNVTLAITLNVAKSETLKHVKTLPI